MRKSVVAMRFVNAWSQIDFLRAVLPACPETNPPQNALKDVTQCSRGCTTLEDAQEGPLYRVQKRLAWAYVTR
jgi:hypothetical protein